jgi:hypothetical protein
MNSYVNPTDLDLIEYFTSWLYVSRRRQISGISSMGAKDDHPLQAHYSLFDASINIEDEGDLPFVPVSVQLNDWNWKSEG